MTARRDDPLDEAIAAFRRAPVPDRPDDAALLSRLAAVPTDGRPSPAPSRPKWRIPMLVASRYAPAAALLLGALGWFALSPPAPVALAEVIRAAEEHRLVRYLMKQLTVVTDGSGEGTSTVYVDLTAPRLRVETRKKTLSDVLDFSSVMVQDNRKDRFLNMNSHTLIVTEDQARDESQARVVRLVKDKGLAKRVARLFRVTREDIKPFSDFGKDQSFLDTLRALQANRATTVTREEIDGRDAFRYRLVVGNKTSTLWVDPKTRLPIRIEHEIIDPAPNIAKNHWTYTDFAWDPAGADPATLFSTEPPAGYIVEDHTKDH